MHMHMPHALHMHMLHMHMHMLHMHMHMHMLHMHMLHMHMHMQHMAYRCGGMCRRGRTRTSEQWRGTIGVWTP